jgi:predicted nucleotidyltransferase
LHGWDRGPDPGPLGRDEVIQVIRESLPALREQFQIQDLWLFGSVARGEATLDSDVDLLVDFELGAEKNFGDQLDLQDALEDLLGVKVDLGSFKNLKPMLQERVAWEMVQIL